MDIGELTAASAQIGISLTADMQMQLQQYAALLQEWNEKINLTAITETGEIMEKHFYDCLLAMSQVNPGNDAADVGTGAGFPGLVFKIARPELRMTLIEPTEKRCRFLEEVICRLDLKQVQVVNARAEDYAAAHREKFDLVAARAVANLPILAELCMPLVKTGGVFLAMKGARGKEEASEGAFAVRELGGRILEIREGHLYDGDTRFNLIIQKERRTPMQYPRPYARIKKKPLQGQGG